MRAQAASTTASAAARHCRPARQAPCRSCGTPSASAAPLASDAASGPEASPSCGIPAAGLVLQTVRERLADDLDAPGALTAIDAWVDAVLAAPGGAASPEAARLIRDTADALLGVAL
jgi:hypothetical protein